MEATLEKLKIYAQRFPAIDGKKPDVAQQWREYRRKFKRTRIDNACAYATMLSHRAVWSDAIEKGYERIMVLEDDVFFHKNFQREFTKKIAEMPAEWKLLYLGASQYFWTEGKGLVKSFNANVDPWYVVRQTCGTYAYGAHRSTLQDLIAFSNCALDNVDNSCLSAVCTKYAGQCFVFYPNLIIADVRDSDIRPGRNQEWYAKQRRWKMENYNVLPALQ